MVNHLISHGSKRDVDRRGPHSLDIATQKEGLRFHQIVTPSPIRRVHMMLAPPIIGITIHYMAKFKWDRPNPMLTILKNLDVTSN